MDDAAAAGSPLYARSTPEARPTAEDGRSRQAQERESLLNDFRRRLSDARPSDHETLWQGFLQGWERLAEHHSADSIGLRLLAYCTEWDPHKGGIVAVNRNLVEGLAAAGHEVFVRVGHPVAPSSAEDRIHLIGPAEPDPARGEQEQLAYAGEDLPPDIDAVIGHSRYSGPEALAVRDALYPDTPFIHVVHMVTGALARTSGRPDLEVEFEDIERRMVAAADMVAGVGPALENEARRLASTNPGDRIPASQEIVPGVRFEEQRLPPWDRLRTRRILFVGRADAEQKGAHHAAQMVGNLSDEGPDVQLTVRGVSPEEAGKVGQRLSAIAGRQVATKPFTIDRGEILADMREADVLVMPSRAEGFGLVALEAAGAGLPVLVPSTSGVGEFLGESDRFPPGVTRLNLVEQGFEDRVDVGRWTDGLRELLSDIPTARQNARTLQQALNEADTTWTGAARSLSAAIRAIPPRRAPRPQMPALPHVAGNGWVNCAQGHPHWGRYGAAGLLPVHRAADGEVSVLLHHREAESPLDGAWAPFDGARRGHEPAAEAALRHAEELGGIRSESVHVERVIRDDHGGWSYDTVIATVDQRAAVRPADGQSSEAAWVPIAAVGGLALHPGFASSWADIRDRLDGAINGGAPSADSTFAAESPSGVARLPAHPVTGARVVAREALELGSGTVNRELATFDDGSFAVYEKYAQAEDAGTKVLDAHIGRALGARIPLSSPVNSREVYTDHMPGETVSARGQAPDADGNRELCAPPDKTLLGLHHTLTASYGVTVGDREGLVWVGSGVAPHGDSPDAANPLVRDFYRQTGPQEFSWVENPVPPVEVPVIRDRLDEVRPVFESLGRLDLHDGIMERFARVAEQASGTGALLPRAPGQQGAAFGPPADQRSAPPPQPGSEEAAEHRQAAEALMTADGRITDTSDAKAVVVRTLAQRMRSSTPALVSAALGKNVGTDMSHLLGDGRYVLAPHHPVYLSIGADVLHVGELDPRKPRHAPGRVVRMDDPRAEPLVREIAVSEIANAWGYGSNNNMRALALQEAAKEEFGLDDALEWHVDADTLGKVEVELDYNRDTLRDFLRTQYEMTQEELAARGITQVIGYRAMAWDEGAPQPDWEHLQAGDSVDMPHRPLSSWTAERRVAADWLEERGGRSLILTERKPARDLLASPVTGLGFLRQREWVALPSDGRATLESVYADGIAVDAEKPRSAAAAVNIGAPAAEDAVEESPPVQQESGTKWRPPAVTAAPDPGNALDARIRGILDGREEAPSWWLRDDTGYAITKRDLEFLGINPIQVTWFLSGEAPLGMTPDTYERFGTELLVALGRSGAMPSQVDVRIKGTGSGFFSGIHKTLPREEELADAPEAARRLREWFGDSPERPLRRPYDSMWRLGLESEPSDVDLDINSTAIVRAAREYWTEQHPDRYSGDFMGGHGYLDKPTVKSACPDLAEWAQRWEARLGRPVSLGVFESSGPMDATVNGRALSSHKRGTDWVIHKPDSPMAWRTPERNSRGAALGLSAPAGAAALAARANPRGARDASALAATDSRAIRSPSHRERRGDDPSPER